MFGFRPLFTPLFEHGEESALKWARALPLHTLEALKATCKTVRRQLAASGLGRPQGVLAVLLLRRTRQNLDLPSQLATRLTYRLLAARMPRPGDFCLTSDH